MAARTRPADDDMVKIQHRASLIHYRNGEMFPFEKLGTDAQMVYEEQAASELWDENALNFEPENTRHRFIE